jgi:glucose/arabinose dehydrogenase
LPDYSLTPIGTAGHHVKFGPLAVSLLLVGCGHQAPDFEADAAGDAVATPNEEGSDGAVDPGTQPDADASAPPPGSFVDRVIFSDLKYPTAVRFARDGRVFVAEKGGVIKVFASLAASRPSVVADLSKETNENGDRGLIDIELDPEFPQRPYLYAFYTLDGRIGDSVAGGTVPRYRDGCPDPWKAGCVVAGRLVRLTVAGDQHETEGSEAVLVENWPQQFTSHSVGALSFGPDGLLYASAGDGASFDQVDYGNVGGNALAEPPDRASGSQKPPSAMGGALRAQVVNPPAPFAAWFSGKIIRIDPRTANPLSSTHHDHDPPAVVAAGLRNPVRMAFRPGGSDLWIADVGWTNYEEINRIADVSNMTVTNFGWPCFEGPRPQPGYESAGLDLCASLSARPGAHSLPLFAYAHGVDLVPADGCGLQNGSAISGLAFYVGGNYPSEYRDALFFSDYARNCIWVMPAGADGTPAPKSVRPFVVGASQPVQLQIGPEGDLYYVDFTGNVRRIEYGGGNYPPRAVIAASQRYGPLPLTVRFDASGSRDPDRGELSYAWDLDGDGAFDDGRSAMVSRTYRRRGRRTVWLKLTDSKGSTTTAETTIWPGHTLPVPVIETVQPGIFSAGERISLTGRASDGDGRRLPGSSLTWSVVLQHCPDACHEHPLQRFEGLEQVTFQAPDHAYPMHLSITLSAVDATGLRASVVRTLQPRTAVVRIESRPSGLSLAWNDGSEKTPFSRTVIVGSTNSVSAPSQILGNVGHRFSHWMDGGNQSQVVVVRNDQARYRAVFEPYSLSEISGQARAILLSDPADSARDDGRERIRDGLRPDPVEADSSMQYAPRDQVVPVGATTYVGYEFDGARTFARVVFQEGLASDEGGFFESLQVEVRRKAGWAAVSGLRSRPSYSGPNGIPWETFLLDFEPITGDAIRLVGRPGGSERFVSIAELEVWGALSPEARVPHGP